MKKYIPLFVILFFVAIAVFGYVVMGLWNWLIPTLFSGPVITFWQAIGILVLSKILFGGFGHGHNKNSKCDHQHDEWKEKIHEKFKDETEFVEHDNNKETD